MEKYYLLNNELNKGDVVKSDEENFYLHVPGKENWLYTGLFAVRYTNSGATYENEYEEIPAEEATKKIAEQDALFDTLIEKASAIARKAHAGATDKGGAPYIRHPEWVANRVAEKEAKVLAWLHDVLEDTDVTEDDLRAEGFPERIILRLSRLTRKDGQKYSEYLECAAKDRFTRAVKRADLENNMDISRIPKPQAEDLRRLNKYAYASAYLLLPESDVNQKLLEKIDEFSS